MSFEARQQAYNFGIFAERWVAFCLFFLGYRLLFHRYKTKLGEIDLIFEKKDTIIAVEVKGRHDKRTVDDVVAPYQLERISRAVKLFLANNTKYVNYNVRIDIVLVSGLFLIKRFKNVWEKW